MGIDRTHEAWADAEPDPLRTAALPLLEYVFAATHDGSAERAAAMGELMSAIDRICAALRPRPRLN
jgi:hypothetical protein